MRHFGLFAACAVAMLIAPLAFGGGLLGVFQGTIVKSSSLNAKTQEQWVYVQSRSGSVRKVNIAKALVEYDESIPAKLRLKNPAESLRLATEVRITAEQDRTSDGDGDWQAQHVLILPVKASIHDKGKVPPRKVITTS
jgi:hypothetical protein